MNTREEQKPKQESAKQPGKDDVHEQRQDSQRREGEVEVTPSEAAPTVRH